MSIKLANNVTTTLASGINTTDTTLTVASGEGSKFPSLGVDEWFYVTIIDQGSINTDNENLEIVKVTAVSGDTLTIERGIDDTSPRAALAGDFVQMRLNKKSLEDMVVEPESKRIYLDNIVLAMDGAPYAVNGSEVKSFNKRWAPELMENWDSYWGPRVKCLIENNTTHVKYDNLSFPTLDDIATWISNNTPGGNSNESIIMKPYETIDPKIPVLESINGYNRTLGALKGSKNYTNAKSDTAINASSDMLNYCADIFNNVYPSATPLTSADGNDLKLTIWLTRAKKNKYGLVSVGAGREAYDIYFESGKGSTRNFRDVNGDIYGNVSTTWGGSSGKYSHNDKYIYCVMDSNLNYNFFGSVSDVNVAMDDGQSAVIAIGVDDNTNNDRKAVVIKPLGIDTVLLDLPDFTRYDLELVYSNSDMQNYTYVKKLTDSDIPHSSNKPTKDPGRSRLRLGTDILFDFSSGAYDNNRFFSRRHNHNVRFRLRDKVTNKVGELSYSGVVTERSKKIMFRLSLIKSFV